MNDAYQDTRGHILKDFTASNWLKSAINALDQRDPLDALKDAETLALLAQMRARKILNHTI
jgi:hypothetical protein